MHELWVVSYGLLWVLLVLMALLLLSVLRQLGNIYLTLERQDAGVLPGIDAGLPIGESAPDVLLWDVSEELHRLTDYRGNALLLIFSFPDCGPCKQLIPELNVFR